MAPRRARSGALSPQRAVGLIRVSTREQATGGVSLEMQEQHIARFCSSEGWELVAVYREPGWSGAGWKKRPGIQALLRDLAEDRPSWDALVVYRLDRLSRQVRYVIPFLADLTERGIAWRSTSEPHFGDDTPIGTAMVSVAASFAQLQRDLTAELVADARYQTAQAGKWSGKPPLGYRSVEGILEPSDEADAVRRAFETYLRGWSIHHVAQQLRLEAGPKWTTSQVHRTLRCPTYAGFIPLGGERFPGRHDALVPLETWERAQRMMASRRHVGRDTRRRYLLSGLLRCPLCGGPMWGARKTYRKRGWDYDEYNCGNGRLKGTCRGRSIRLRKAHRCLVAALRALAKAGADLGAIEYVPRPSQDEDARRRLEQDVAAIPRRRLRYVDMAGRGLISEDDLRDALAALVAEAHGKEQALAALPTAAPSARRLHRSFRYLADLLESDVLPAEKRLILAGHLERIVVERNGDVSLRVFYPDGETGG